MGSDDRSERRVGFERLKAVFYGVKKEEPKLEAEVANQILENVFETCRMEPCTVPLTVLEAYSNYRTERFSLQRVIIVVMMVLFCLLPFLFVAPSFALQEGKEEQKGHPTYQVDVDTFLPISSVVAEVDGKNVPVYEVGENRYSVIPTLNGEMTVTVILKNKQYIERKVPVDNVDRKAPTVLSNEMVDGRVYLYLQEDDSGVDAARIEIFGISGAEYTEFSYDEEMKCLSIPFPAESVNIFIPDKAENVLQLVLTVEEPEDGEAHSPVNSND